MPSPEALLLPSDVAGVNQFTDNPLELSATYVERACDVVELHPPLVRTRQQIAEYTLGFD